MVTGKQSLILKFFEQLIELLVKISAAQIFNISGNDLETSALRIKIHATVDFYLHSDLRSNLKLASVSRENNTVDYTLIVFNGEISMISG